MTEIRWRVGAVLFEQFELLDAFGPLEMFGVLPGFSIDIIAQHPGFVASAQGPATRVDFTFTTAPPIDILLLPGGHGTRREVGNPAMLDFLRERAAAARFVATVCTGSGLLAATGLLDGRHATSNKRAWAWSTSRGRGVRWQPQARWCEDGPFYTSGGVAAGIDMALALIARLEGIAVAGRVADATEYEWHRDPGWDPFAARAGLLTD